MSKHEPYGNVKMKGKKTKLLPCGCCVARNGKKHCENKRKNDERTEVPLVLSETLW